MTRYIYFTNKNLHIFRSILYFSIRMLSSWWKLHTNNLVAMIRLISICIKLLLCTLNLWLHMVDTYTHTSMYVYMFMRLYAYLRICICRCQWFELCDFICKVPWTSDSTCFVFFLVSFYYLHQSYQQITIPDPFDELSQDFLLDCIFKSTVTNTRIILYKHVSYNQSKKGISSGYRQHI